MFWAMVIKRFVVMRTMMVAFKRFCTRYFVNFLLVIAFNWSGLSWFFCNPILPNIRWRIMIRHLPNISTGSILLQIDRLIIVAPCRPHRRILWLLSCLQVPLRRPFIIHSIRITVVIGSCGRDFLCKGSVDKFFVWFLPALCRLFQEEFVVGFLAVF